MGLEKPLGPALAARLFGDPTRRLALLRAAWPAAVGPDLSRRTEVLALEGRTLRVRVPDAGWRKVLHRMRGEILARLRGIAGSLAPTALGFTEGGVPEAPRDSRPAPAATPTAPAVVIEGAGAIADADLRALFLASAARYLARGGAGPGRSRSGSS